MPPRGAATNALAKRLPTIKATAACWREREQLKRMFPAVVGLSCGVRRGCREVGNAGQREAGQLIKAGGYFHFASPPRSRSTGHSGLQLTTHRAVPCSHRGWLPPPQEALGMVLAAMPTRSDSGRTIRAKGSSKTLSGPSRRCCENGEFPTEVIRIFACGKSMLLCLPCSCDQQAQQSTPLLLSDSRRRSPPWGCQGCK